MTTRRRRTIGKSSTDVGAVISDFRYPGKRKYNPPAGLAPQGRIAEVPKHFGEIPGYPEGTAFDSRTEIYRAGLHRHTIAGISGSGSEGADAIVLAGGYEDDEDHGDVIVYTGEGGNQGRRQIADQQFTKGNRALARSRLEGLPVRVIRGYRHRSKYSPRRGYRYDGLYFVESFWKKRGKSGYQVYQYKLVKLTDNLRPVMERASDKPSGANEPGRVNVGLTRVVRDTEVTRWVKNFYDYSCQVCGVRLLTPSGPYCEAAHIRPLGRPHNGPDVPSNVLCLCPNHHVLFDLGSFVIADDFSLIGVEGLLKLRAEHAVSLEYLAYHRERFGFL